MSHSSTPTTLIIVGITGDLAARKLLPAIVSLSKADQLPADFHILGISRRDVSTDEVVNDLPDTIDDAGKDFLRQHLRMHQMDLRSEADYHHLQSRLDDLDNAAPDAQRLFYLSVPPQVSQPIVTHLGSVGLSHVPNTKLLLEKPFGTDLETAHEFINHVAEHFNESQVYRIDHYLAKEMAQNILIFRSRNSLFKHTWNSQFIEKIEIIAAESIGIEGRAQFYEQTGALRDVVQSHLLQLAALTLMELPDQSDDISDWDQVPAERLKALKQLRPFAGGNMSGHALRGQYEGYAEEVGNPGSTVETFTSILLESADKRWDGVPIQLIAGKALATKQTEIRIHYRQDHHDDENQLVLHIQPDEGIAVHLWSKRPGYDRELEKVTLDYMYDHHEVIPEAYERVFLDALHGDHALFATNDEVIASWEVLAPVQKAWQMSLEQIIRYKPGSDFRTIIQEHVT